MYFKLEADVHYLLIRVKYKENKLSSSDWILLSVLVLELRSKIPTYLKTYIM